eukprot:scaffold274399_cov37-Tisochrysis_lutea.AAC.4
MVVSGATAPRCPGAEGLGIGGTVRSARPHMPRKGAGSETGGWRKPACGEPMTGMYPTNQETVAYC